MKVIGAYQNGNILTQIWQDGTKIRKTPDDEFIPDHAENMDIKITDYCENRCPFCHEGSSINGKHCDIDAPFWDTLNPYQEVALGGGNPLSHPRLEELLYKLRNRNVIANITVRQNDFVANYEKLKKWYQEKLIYGIGVSYVNPSVEDFELIKSIPTAVLHTINGMLSLDDINFITYNAESKLKVLILGYKDVRRGIAFKELFKKDIYDNQMILKENLFDMFKKCSVVSFDNLAIEQLGIQDIVSPEEWERYYMGDDGTITFYIDAVNMKYAQSSTAALDDDHRFDIGNKNVNEMFYDIAERGNNPYMKEPVKNIIEKFHGQCSNIEFNAINRIFKNVAK